MLKMYATRDEAIHAEIVDALGVWADHFDIDALADLCILQHANGKYFFTVTSEEFWDYARECSLNDYWKPVRRK